jgi:hypothetical protein
LTRDGKNQFHITALQAQQFDLYRDGTYIKSFWETSMIDEETDPTKEHTYYIMGEKLNRGNKKPHHNHSFFPTYTDSSKSKLTVC